MDSMASKTNKWGPHDKPIGYKSPNQISLELKRAAAEERVSLDIRVFQAIFNVDKQSIERKTLANEYPHNLQTANMMMLRRGTSIGYSLPTKTKYFMPVYVSPNNDECKMIAQNLKANGVQSLDSRAIIAILSDQTARSSVVRELGIKRFEDAAAIFNKYDWRNAIDVCGPSGEKALNDSMQRIIKAVRDRFSR